MSTPSVAINHNGRCRLVVVRAAGVRIIHDGQRYAESNQPPKTALRAIDGELARHQLRVTELKLARGALVASVRALG